MPASERGGCAHVMRYSQPSPAGIPVCGLSGDRLGLGDDPILDRDRLHPGAIPRCLVLLLTLVGLLRKRAEAALEAFEISYCLGLVDSGVQPGDGRPGLATGEIGAGDPPLDQADLGRERVVPAGEEGERLIRAASLPDPDHALAL